ncbi:MULTISPECIES: putative entry exclusion protein TrbK-alt [unclassified Bradyrhizobium]|uniref:putative entry exclusion protein TrbK-alt n=1 Tax=Bradyrhizobium TaxID=374 RepID=UPI0028E4AA17|nr:MULTISPECIES: putative entry exclusion protein TrbK-alt [unclassified Bradyrhizobium]
MQRSPVKWLRLFAVAAATLATLSACTIPLRGGQDTETRQPAPKSNALDETLTRCRAVRPEQADAFAQCRRLWSEGRRRFFGTILPATPSSGSPSPALDPVERTR